MVTQQSIDHDSPSPDTLAGVYICVEGAEEVLVEVKKNVTQSSQANGGAGDAAKETKKASGE